MIGGLFLVLLKHRNESFQEAARRIFILSSLLYTFRRSRISAKIF
jgi:hypothetical protein